MYCPECGSALQNGYCPRCRVHYNIDAILHPDVVKKCPHCGGDMGVVGKRVVGLLLLPLGMKSKIYKCQSCGYECTDRDFGTLHNDKEFQQAKKDTRAEIGNKIKKFAREKL